MKYRSLSIEELELLEKEFVNFLAVNGIDAPLWVEIKENDTRLMLTLIEQFSDMVLEASLQKIHYAEFAAAKSLQAIHFLPEKMICAGIRLSSDSNIDLTKPEHFKQLASGEIALNAKYFVTEQPYTKSREEDIFLLLETGFSIADSKLFEVLVAAQNK
jgi:hypothetical protein